MLFELEIVTEFLNILKDMKKGQSRTFRYGADTFTITKTRNFFEVESITDSECAQTFIEFSNAIMHWNMRFVEM